MENTETTGGRNEMSPDQLKGLLAAAGTLPVDKKMKTFNPMESIPTLAVGDDIKPGQLISGVYVRTERISSPKFTYSKERDEKGVPVQYRHILRLNNGSLLGIWTTGELTNVFAKRTEGTTIGIKYVKKGLNGNNQQQHFFEYFEEETAAQ